MFATQILHNTLFPLASMVIQQGLDPNDDSLSADCNLLISNLRKMRVNFDSLFHGKVIPITPMGALVNIEVQVSNENNKKTPIESFSILRRPYIKGRNNDVGRRSHIYMSFTLRTCNSRFVFFYTTIKRIFSHS